MIEAEVIFLALVEVGKVLIDNIAKSYDAFENLNREGILLTQTVMGSTNAYQNLATSVQDTGLTLSNFVNLVKTHAQIFAAVGMARMTQALKLAAPAMQKLGINADEAGEFVASYLEAEKGYGVIRQKSAQEIAQDSTDFAKSMQELSYMTGKSKQELMKQVIAMQQNIDVWSSVTSGNEILGKNVKLLAGAMGDSGLAGDIASLAASPYKYANKTIQSLYQAGASGVANKMLEFTNKLNAGTMSAGDMNVAIKHLANDLKGQDLTRLRLLAEAGDASAQQTLKMLKSVQDSADALGDVSDEELRNQSKVAEAQAKIHNSLNKIYNVFETSIFGNPALFESIGNALEAFANFLHSDAIQKPLREFTQFLQTLFSGNMKDAGKIHGQYILTISGTIVKLVWAAVKEIPGLIVSIFSGFVEFILGEFEGIDEGIWDFISGIFTSIISGITTKISDLWSVITQAFAPLQNVISKVIGGITYLWGKISAFGNYVGKIGEIILDGIGNTLSKIGPQLLKVIADVSDILFPGVRAALAKLWDNISSIVPKVLAVVSGVFNSIMMSISSAFKSIIDSVMSVVNNISNFISSTIAGIVGMISGLFTTVMSYITGKISGVWDFISGIFTSIISGITTKISDLWSVITQAFAPLQVVLQPFSQLISDICGVFKIAYDGIMDVVSKISKLSPTNWFSSSKDSDKVTTTPTGVGGSPVKSQSQIATVTSNPAPTMVKSPSAAITPSAKDSQSAPAPITNSGNAVANSAPQDTGADMKAIMTYQNALLEKILNKQSESLSTNKEQLKVARNAG